MTKNERRGCNKDTPKKTVLTKINDFFTDYGFGIIIGFGFLALATLVIGVLVINSNTKEADYKVDSYEIVGDSVVVKYIENDEIKEVRFPKKQIRYEESDEMPKSPILSDYCGDKWKLTIYIEKGEEK